MKNKKSFMLILIFIIILIITIPITIFISNIINDKNDIKKETFKNVYVKESILEKAKKLVYTEDGKCKNDETIYEYIGGCYIKGLNENNYIWYNGFMWRIMGINEDKTVRLITNESVTSIPYGSEGSGETYAKNDGDINDWLNDYFYNKLNNTKSIIKSPEIGKYYFCSQTTNNIPFSKMSARTTCSEESIVTSKIGLLTYDEYKLANAETSYLYIGYNFWTITPYNESRAWLIYWDHITGAYIPITAGSGIRPVINVDGNAIVTKGKKGTTSDYFVLVENKTKNIKGTIGENVTSGEYVNLEGKIYRVVSKDIDGVKLILDSYVGELAYGNDNAFTLTSGVGLKLNSETDNTSVINTLGLKKSNKIVETIWYQGKETSNKLETFKYKDTLLEINGTGITAKIGLIRLGEMLSGQSATMLTKNYTSPSSYENVNYYWTMNKNIDTNEAYFVRKDGFVNRDLSTKTYGIRPVIKVKSDLEIKNGTGTWDNPYQI